MNTSIILAQILGLYITILALVLIIRADAFLKLTKEFKTESAVIFIGLLVSLILGIIILVFHNVWVAAWPIVITLLGWFIFLRSIIYLFFPKVLPKVLNLVSTKKALYLSGIIMGVLGLFLIYHGFFPLKINF